MGRGQLLTTATSRPALNRNPRVSLYGGPADGWIVELSSNEREVAVYELHSGEHLTIAEGEAAPDGRLLGVYRSSGSRGPERPTYCYVATAVCPRAERD